MIRNGVKEMISKKMENMVANSSAIRAMFEEGNRLAKIYGAENVYDFSLGNPNVPAPEAVKKAMIDILNEEDPIVLHGYTNSNAGYEDVRQAVADSLNERFGTSFAAKNITMTVGAAGGLNVILKALLNPGDEVVVFAPYFGEYRSYVNNFDGVLVEISPNAAPPVCRITDYQKFLYQQKKRQKEQKAKSVKVIVKEIRFGPQTDDHDYNFKLKHARGFLEDGDKVKAYVFFKGRSILFKEQGEVLLLRFANDLEDYAKVDQMPVLEGKRMTIQLSPKKKEAPKKPSVSKPVTPGQKAEKPEAGEEE